MVRLIAREEERLLRIKVALFLVVLPGAIITRKIILIGFLEISQRVRTFTAGILMMVVRVVFIMIADFVAIGLVRQCAPFTFGLKTRLAYLLLVLAGQPTEGLEEVKVDFHVEFIAHVRVALPDAVEFICRQTVIGALGRTLNVAIIDFVPLVHEARMIGILSHQNVVQCLNA